MNIIYKIVKQKVAEAVWQKENGIVENLTREDKVLYGQFVRLQDLKDYKANIPREIYEDMMRKLAGNYHVEIYENEIKRLEHELRQLKRELWDKEHWLENMFSLGLYGAMHNPYNDN